MDYVDQRVAQLASAVHTSTTALFTPLNAVILSALLYAAYAFLLRASPHPITLPREQPAVVFTTFTPRTLLPYNGENNMPVYLAVRGRVFNVTPGRNFYGPGGPYANFAGRDASRGLACSSFDEDMLTKDLDGPLDTLSDLGPAELDTLRGWEERFEDKYLVVGRLVAAGEEREEDWKGIGN
ncbi:cytochrome b5 [Parathielavia hyrcaniae]|uniref:Cytochrome b5 n=1 Tax=Parathielavia hyrcaniae TaxID=113614 RepID=A0AAN6Q5T0_9PEZI|nr:cytochrome b5 [Parathielavia hyrcaniae]